MSFSTTRVKEQKAPLRFQGAQSVQSKFEIYSITAVSRFVSVFLPETSVQACWAQVASAAAVALMAAVPTQEECAEAADARSGAKFAVAEPVHSG